MGLAGGGEEDGDLEAGLEDLQGYVGIDVCGCVRDVETEMTQGRLGLAYLGVRLACMVGTVEDDRIAAWQVLGVLVADSVEETRRAGVLASKEERGGEHLAQLQCAGWIGSSRGGVLEQADCPGRVICIQQRLDVTEQQV